MAAFLQTWLFFGLLKSLFDFPTRMDDFIRQDAQGRKFITTSLLPKYLKDWKQRYDTLEESEKEIAGDTAYSHLTQVNTVNDMLTYLLFYGKPISGTDILKQTLFSQMLLAEALDRTRV